MSTRAIVTFATGGHRELLELARPGFEAYAARHGYDLLETPPRGLQRPASWGKLLALADALDAGYREALWLDADIVIVEDARDLASDVPPDAVQALVRHHTPDGEVPNCGVWLVRQPMRLVLDELWGMRQYLDHPWWEQAALLDLLGYRGRPVTLQTPSELYQQTHWLGLEWNSHEQNDRHDRPRFVHATAGSIAWRASVMRFYMARTLAPD